MSLRDYLKKLDEGGRLLHVVGPISKSYEIAGVLKKAEPEAVLFEHVKESEFRVVGNLFGSKGL